MAAKKKNRNLPEIKAAIKAIEKLYRNKKITGIYIKENIVFGFLVTLGNVQEHIELDNY